MELRDRIARTVIPHLYHMFSEWEDSDDVSRREALEIADDVIDSLSLSREVEAVAPRENSWTKFEPHEVERFVTPWERPN